MRQITVGLIEQNLFAHYLQRLLRRNGMRVHSSDIFFRPDPANKTPISVFVIDLGTLSVPLHVCAEQLMLHYPDSKVLLLGDKPAHFHLLLMLELGIHGFVRYPDVKKWLVKAIRSVMRGAPWFPQEVLDRFAASAEQTGRHWHSLTKREQLIVLFLERRLSNKEIAVALNISENTVKFHLANIFRKLGVHDRYSVVIAAISRKIRGERKIKSAHAGAIHFLADGPVGSLGGRRHSA